MRRFTSRSPISDTTNAHRGTVENKRKTQINLYLFVWDKLTAREVLGVAKQNRCHTSKTLGFHGQLSI